MKIAVLFGGTSEEREVSIASAAQIIPALRGLGHEVFAVDTATGRLPPADEKRLLTSGVAPQPPSTTAMEQVRGRAIAFAPSASDIRSADVVFLALHGGAGEDGRLQAMLDLAGLAYTGSNHIASAAAMDKDLSKRLFRSVGVPTADWMMVPAEAADVARTLGWPVVVKPSKQGSTVGLTVVRQAADLARAIQVAQAFDDEVMVERFIAGREFTVGILDGVALPVGEIISPGEIFDYQAKYQVGGAREVFPAGLPAGGGGPITGIRASRTPGAEIRCLQPGGLSTRRQRHVLVPRGEFLARHDRDQFIAAAAQVAGINFPELLERICKGAVRRQKSAT